MQKVQRGPNCFYVFVYSPLIPHRFDTFLLVTVSAMIQQPRVPSSGLRPASDVLIHAKEVSQIYFATPCFYIGNDEVCCVFV
jgi:hypothetical protein